MSDNPEYMKLVRYVNAATDLAEAIERDVKAKNRKVSNDTVIKLSKFTMAANLIQKMLDQVEQTNYKLN